MIIALMLACAMGIQAQTTVKGLLKDSLTQEAEPYATVRIYAGQQVKQNSSPVAMALTDAEGKFNATVKAKGAFVAVATSMGKAAAVRNFTITNEKSVDLGQLMLSDKTSDMKGVEVVAVRPIVKMEADKVTYSVEDDVDSRSMTVLDMLRKVPMVMVDGQDNITVNGQSSFKIYVDGKPNMMLSSNPGVILKSLPASMVSNIEVITNPGAKYDAEGAGGILNFTMAKMGGAAGGAAATDISGYNGSITATGGNRNVGGTATIAGQEKKLSYNATVNYTYTDNGTVKQTWERKQKDGTSTLFETTARNRVPLLMGNVGLGYEIDAQSSVNGSFSVQRFDVTNSGDPRTIMKMGGMNFGYQNHMVQKIDNTGYSGSLDYQRFFDPKRANSLTITYQINHTPTHHDSEMTGYEALVDGASIAPSAATTSGMMPNDRLSNGTERTTEHIGQIDLVNTLSEHSKLNTGAKYSFRKSTSENEYFEVQEGKPVFMPGQSTDYDHRNQIGAIYAESENTWSKWTAKAGLRYEHTWQKVMYKDSKKNFNDNYGNLVPSASLSYALLPGSSLGLTYNMRISRPGISYLNPYRDNSEPTSVNYGNPDLKVEKTHNIGLVLNLYTPIVIVSTSLRQTLANGGIEQYSFFDDRHVLNTTFGNIVDRSLSTFNLFASASVTKNTRLTLNGSVTYNYLKSGQLDLTNKGWSARGLLNIQQTLPKKWTLGLTAISNSKSISLQGHTSGMNIGVLTISKSLCKDRLNLSVNGVTGLSKGGKIYIGQYAEGKDFTSDMQISVPVTRVIATARWTFGNTTQRFKDHKSKVQDDYIEHQSSTESIGNAGSTTGGGGGLNISM